MNRFLQEVWNEALVTGRKSVEDLNLIAWRHLSGDGLNSAAADRQRSPQKPFTIKACASRTLGEHHSGNIGSDLFADRRPPRLRFFCVAGTNPSSSHCVPQLRPGRFEPRKCARLLRSIPRKLPLFRASAARAPKMTSSPGRRSFLKIKF